MCRSVTPADFRSSAPPSSTLGVAGGSGTGSEQAEAAVAAGSRTPGSAKAGMGDATGASIGGTEVATGANVSSSVAPNKGVAEHAADRLHSLSGLIQIGQDHLKSMDDRTVVTAAPINLQASG